MATTDLTQCTVSDLSDRVPGLLGGESMQATNMVSTTPDFGAPGSESEATSGVTPRDPDPVVPPEGGHRQLDRGDGGHLPGHPEWTASR